MARKKAREIQSKLKVVSIPSCVSSIIHLCLQINFTKNSPLCDNFFRVIFNRIKLQETRHCRLWHPCPRHKLSPRLCYITRTLLHRITTTIIIAVVTLHIPYQHYQAHRYFPHYFSSFLPYAIKCCRRKLRVIYFSCFSTTQ